MLGLILLPSLPIWGALLVGAEKKLERASERLSRWSRSSFTLHMPVLRNADRAIIDERKVRDYLLNPLHARGGHKARMFASALGYQRFDYMRLIEQIRVSILKHEALPADAVPHGERFRVEIPVVGPTGSAMVRTLWIIRTGEDVPRLTSAYPIK